MRRLLALFLAMTFFMPLASAATYQVNENGDTEFHYSTGERIIGPGETDVFIIDVKKGMDISTSLTIINTTSENSSEMIHMFALEGGQSIGGMEASLKGLKGDTLTGPSIGNYGGMAEIKVYADNTTTYSIEIKSTYSILEAIGLSGLCTISLLITASLIAVYHYASVKQKRDALKEAGELGEDIKENPEKHIER